MCISFQNHSLVHNIYTNFPQLCLGMCMEHNIRERCECKVTDNDAFITLGNNDLHDCDPYDMIEGKSLRKCIVVLKIMDSLWYGKYNFNFFLLIPQKHA